jgi:hypothetical protein
MKMETHELLKRVVYYGIASAFLCGASYCFWTGAREGDPAANLGGLIIGLALLLPAAILFVFPLSRILSSPWGKLLYPDAKFDRPQPLYSLAEAQARREEYETAMTTYEQIAADFPEEIRPWIGMVEIAVMALNDLHRADTIYQRGIEQLTNPQARDTLERMFRGIRSRRDEAPEWGKKRTIDLVPSPRARRGGRRNFR